MDDQLQHIPDTPMVLSLYITGASPNSARAIEAVTAICEQYLAGHYRLEVIDVYQQPEVAAEQQIIALPMLVRNSPEPERRLIGDMRNTEKVLRILGIDPDNDSTWPKD